MQAANPIMLRLSQVRLPALLGIGLFLAPLPAVADGINWGLPGYVAHPPAAASATSPAAAPAPAPAATSTQPLTMAAATLTAGEASAAESHTDAAAPAAQPTPVMMASADSPPTVASNDAVSKQDIASSALPPVANTPAPPVPAPKPKARTVDDLYPFKDKPALDAKHELPMPMSPADSGAIAPEMARAWSQDLQMLEQENQILRAKLGLTATDKLADIKVDAVSQIREDVLRARVVELEKELDKLHMQNNLGNLPDKSGASQPATGGKAF